MGIYKISKSTETTFICQFQTPDITITCDRAWVDPAIVDAIMDAGVGRIDAREGSISRIDAGIEGSNSLLMGKLIGQGAIRSEVVDSARQQGVGPSEIEEVKGREVAESARQHVDPQDELEIGRKIKEYQQNPQDAQVRMDIGSARGGHGG